MWAPSNAQYQQVASNMTTLTRAYILGGVNHALAAAIVNVLCLCCGGSTVGGGVLAFGGNFFVLVRGMDVFLVLC